MKFSPPKARRRFCVCVLLRNTIKVNLLLKASLDKLNVTAHFCAHHYGATGRVVFTSNAH